MYKQAAMNMFSLVHQYVKCTGLTAASLWPRNIYFTILEFQFIQAPRRQVLHSWGGRGLTIQSSPFSAAFQALLSNQGLIYESKDVEIPVCSSHIVSPAPHDLHKHVTRLHKLSSGLYLVLHFPFT
jgi:hypothetical protein